MEIDSSSPTSPADIHLNDLSLSKAEGSDTNDATSSVGNGESEERKTAIKLFKTGQYFSILYSKTFFKRSLV